MTYDYAYITVIYDGDIIYPQTFYFSWVHWGCKLSKILTRYVGHRVWLGKDQNRGSVDFILKKWILQKQKILIRYYAFANHVPNRQNSNITISYTGHLLLSYRSTCRLICYCSSTWQTIRPLIAGTSLSISKRSLSA